MIITVNTLMFFLLVFLWVYIYKIWVRLISCINSEKAMATHSSTLAWKIPWTEEPGRPQSLGSWRVRHDWATSLSLFTFMHWRRKWQPTPVFPGMAEPGGLPSLGSHSVGHDWSNLAAAAACINSQYNLNIFPWSSHTGDGGQGQIAFCFLA